MSVEAALAALATLRAPDWMADWDLAHPRRSGEWTTVRRVPAGTGRPGAGTPDRGRLEHGLLRPETGRAEPIEPTADPKLKALRSVLDASAGSPPALVGYRARRRAVVRTPEGYVKVVRPARAEAIAGRHQALVEPLHRRGLRSPRIRSWGPGGTVDLAVVAGPSLHALLRMAAGPAQHGLGRTGGILERIGAAVALFHSLDPEVLPDAGRAVPEGPMHAVETVRRAEPVVAELLEPFARSLPALPAPTRLVLGHGDLHDKNLVWHPSGVGFLDLDGVAVRPPEEDLANLAVHLELRALQAGRGEATGSAWATALRAGYRSVSDQELDEEARIAYEGHTWFRLGCLYLNRRRSRSFVPVMLRRCAQRTSEGWGETV